MWTLIHHSMCVVLLERVRNDSVELFDAYKTHPFCSARSSYTAPETIDNILCYTMALSLTVSELDHSRIRSTPYIDSSYSGANHEMATDSPRGTKVIKRGTDIVVIASETDIVS